MISLRKMCQLILTISVLNLYSENKCEIKEYFPRSFHTKNNYYIPSVDKEIKKYETMLGKLHEKLSEAVKCNNGCVKKSL